MPPWGRVRKAMRVGIVGYGRFGRAFGGLLQEAGVAHRAHDPWADVPEDVRASSPAEIAATSDLVVVAVPVGAVRSSLEELRPHLHPSHTVIDVGSVKVGPAESLEAVLGNAVPWVPTHPLFGPTSLALGERPLRVVVCPSPRHPEAFRRVVAFFQGLGCHTIEQDPRAHDRLMAETHALTFFVAKGMLDAGAGEGEEFTPPSFQAIARTIETVRSDAGHLYSALHRENPFAADARRRLLDALVQADRELTRPAEEPTERGQPSISDLGAEAPGLRMTRDLIDEVDRELVALLGRRLLLAARAGRAKAQAGAVVFDPEREAALLAERQAWGVGHGIDPVAVEDIFEAILRCSRREQGR